MSKVKFLIRRRCLHPHACTPFWLHARSVCKHVAEQPCGRSSEPQKAPDNCTGTLWLDCDIFDEVDMLERLTETCCITRCVHMFSPIHSAFMTCCCEQAEPWAYVAGRLLESYGESCIANCASPKRDAAHICSRPMHSCPRSSYCSNCTTDTEANARDTSWCHTS